ncbi:MAG: hypothetical protein NTW32_20075, partial [Chloroflexi bacterium]|nr:hypothetical protein [Chloroflexota bacterium]
VPVLGDNLSHRLPSLKREGGERGFFLWSFAPGAGAKTPLAGQTSDYESPERQNQDGKPKERERRAGEYMSGRCQF